MGEDQQNRAKEVSEAFKALGEVIFKNVKSSPDLSSAARKLRETKMILVDCIAGEEFA